MVRVLPVIVVMVVAACAADTPNSRLVSGEQRLAGPGGFIWYKVTNDSGGRGLPLVLVHGGPGFASFYMKSLEGLANERPVIRYDQLGNGKSDTTSDTSRFTIAHHVAELDSLRHALGVERWHVYGHSWGTIVALEYYRAHPENVAGMVLAGSVIDYPAYGQYVRSLLPTLSDSAQRAIRRAEQTGRFDDPHFQNANMEFMLRYATRRPVQADMESTMTRMNQAMYVYMSGPTDYLLTGTLKTYSGVDFLPSVGVPVLFTGGEFDEVGPEIIRAHAGMVPGARFELIRGSAHVSMWDDPEANNRVVGAFLRQADSAVTRR